MGLFGRDDRSDASKPSPAEARSQRPNDSAAAGSSTTLIARTSHVEGEIKGAGEVRIEGTVKGKLDCSATVVVARGGTVEGELHAETISIAGKVAGDVFATQKIELTPTAEVEGDVTSPRILIREGAIFEGQVSMTSPRPGTAPKASKKAAADDAKGDDGNAEAKDGDADTKPEKK